MGLKKRSTKKKIKLEEDVIGSRMAATILFWARLSLGYGWSKTSGEPIARGQSALRAFSLYIKEKLGSTFHMTAISGFERAGRLVERLDRIARINREYVAMIYAIPEIAPPYAEGDVVALTAGSIPAEVTTATPIQDLIEAERKKGRFQARSDSAKLTVEDFTLASFGIFLYGAEKRFAELLGMPIDEVLTAGMAQLYKDASMGEIEMGTPTERPKQTTAILLDRIKGDCDAVIENGDREVLESLLTEILSDLAKPECTLEELAGMRTAGEIFRHIRGRRSQSDFAKALDVEESIVADSEAAGTIKGDRLVVGDSDYVEKLAKVSKLIFEWDKVVALQEGREARQWITLMPLSQIVETRRLIDIDFDARAKELAITAADLKDPVEAVLSRNKDGALAALLGMARTDEAVYSAIAEIYRRSLSEARKTWESIQ